MSSYKNRLVLCILYCTVMYFVSASIPVLTHGSKRCSDIEMESHAQCGFLRWVSLRKWSKRKLLFSFLVKLFKFLLISLSLFHSFNLTQKNLYWDISECKKKPHMVIALIHTFLDIHCVLCIMWSFEFIIYTINLFAQRIFSSDYYVILFSSKQNCLFW